MDAVVNPYRPGAGRRPPLLAGRQPILDAFTVVRRRAAEHGDLAAALGKKRAPSLSVERDELIKKGLVYAPERGLLAFTVPGMHNFITLQD